MSELMFENLNPYQNLTFLVGNSPEELMTQLAQIKDQIKIISIYGNGGNHYIWFSSSVKIKKTTKKGK